MFNVPAAKTGTLNMIGSSYTAPLVINGSNQIWSGNGGSSFFDSDRLYVWDVALNAGAGGYRLYYLWSGDGKWYDASNDAFPTTDSIPMGAGAWYKNMGALAATWTEIRPYTP